MHFRHSPNRRTKFRVSQESARCTYCLGCMAMRMIFHPLQEVRQQNEGTEPNRHCRVHQERLDPCES